MIQQDRLFLILQNRIENFSEKDGDVDDLVYHSVGDYIAELFTQAHIPFRQLDHIEEFLREEADDIIKKLTYGTTSFQDYLEKRKLKRQQA